MSRVIIGLQPGAQWQQVAEALRVEGAEDVDAPRESLPDVVVATFPDEWPIDVALAAASSVPGVAYAEPDTFQFAFEP